MHGHVGGAFLENYIHMLCIYHQSCVSNYALLSPSRACTGALISVIKLAADSAGIYTGWCMHDQTQIPINVISPEGLLNFGTEHRKVSLYPFRYKF